MTVWVAQILHRETCALHLYPKAYRTRIQMEEDITKAGYRKFDRYTYENEKYIVRIKELKVQEENH